MLIAVLYNTTQGEITYHGLHVGPWGTADRPLDRKRLFPCFLQKREKTLPKKYPLLWEVPLYKSLNPAGAVSDLIAAHVLCWFSVLLGMKDSAKNLTLQYIT